MNYSPGDQHESACWISESWTHWSGDLRKWNNLIVLFGHLLSCVQLFATPWIITLQASLSFLVSYPFLRFVSIESVLPSNHLILCRPLLLPPSIFPSIRVFSNESTLHIRWSKYWSFCLSISPSNEHPGLISFRMDWMDLLAVQGTLKSLFQHHCSTASILRRSAFFIAQLSHPSMTTGKAIAFTRLTFVAKMMSLLFNMLSRFVINKYLLLDTQRGQFSSSSWQNHKSVS